MAAYRRVYDSRYLQADCQEPGSAPEPYARQSSIGYLYLYLFLLRSIVMSVSVCVCVCLFVRDHIFGTAHPIFTNFYACYLWPWIGPRLAA